MTRSPLLNLHVTRPSHSRGYPVYAVAFYCPLCEEVWGRVYPNLQAVTVPQMVGCEDCKWVSEFNPVWGSLLSNDIFEDGIDWGLLNYLPPDLLEREFNLTIEALSCQNQQRKIAPITTSMSLT